MTEPTTDATMAALLGPMELKLNRELVKYAVQRQITCERSGKILDMRRAVLVTLKSDTNERSVCMDGAAYDEVADKLKEQCDRAKVALEVLDGRELWKRPSRAGKLRHEA